MPIYSPSEERRIGLLQDLPATTSSVAGAFADEAFYFSPSQSIKRGLEQDATHRGQPVMALEDQKKIIEDAGVNLKPNSFYTRKTLDVLIDHADLMIELTSIKNIALGPDFYAYFNADWEYVENVDNPSELFRVSDKFSERGYSKKEIECICYENLSRFIKRHLR